MKLKRMSSCLVLEREKIQAQTTLIKLMRDELRTSVPDNSGLPPPSV